MISRLSGWILENRFIAFILILVNLVGFIYGVYYYMPQLDDTPKNVWLLVVDCPLYVILFSIVLFFELLKKPLPGILKFITATGLFKYGMWTVIVVILHFDLFFSAHPLEYSILLPLHLGMALESLLLLGLFRPNSDSTLFVISFFVLNDVSDYVFGTLPRIPETWVPLLFVESLVVSVVFPLGLYFHVRRV